MSARSFRRAHQRRLASQRRWRARRKARAALIAGGAAGAFALAPSAAQAATNYEVNSLNDAPADACDPTPDGCTLRDAIAAANADATDSTITFASTLSGTIHLTQGQLNATDPNTLAIDGPGKDILSVSGDNATRVFAFTGTGPATLSALTITGGNVTGTARGGGIYANSTPGTGGLTLDRVAVSGNVVSGSGSGGGVYSGRPLTISDSDVTANNATGTAGGAGIASTFSLTVTGSTVSGNTAAQAGGAISQGSKYQPMSITSSVISGNSASVGGGVFKTFTGKYPAATKNDISNTTISGNHATSQGGGIAFGGMITGDQFTVSHSTISGNDAVGGGGIALPNTVYGDFELIDSTVAGNSATTGGGIRADRVSSSGAIGIGNSTIASNNASAAGGGIYLDSYPSSGGPLVSATLPLDSTIVADNATNGAPQDLDRADASTAGGFDLSFSLVESPGDAAITQTPAGSSIVGKDPQLGGLADNGGPTLTELPAVTSPVVDQGFAPPRLTTDQRGDPRTVDTSVPNPPHGDGTDIGAVELQQGPAPTVKITGFPKKKQRPKAKHVIRTKHERVKVQISFTANDPSSRFECRVDKGPFRPCSSPFTANVRSKPGKGKHHTISVRAIDPAGNVAGPPVSVGFVAIRVD